MIIELHNLYIKSDSNYVRDRLREIAQYEFNRMFQPDSTLTVEEVSLGKKEGKISAIREYRSRTGKSLIESKNMVENYFSKYGFQFLNQGNRVTN